MAFLQVLLKDLSDLSRLGDEAWAYSNVMGVQILCNNCQNMTCHHAVMAIKKTEA